MKQLPTLVVALAVVSAVVVACRRPAAQAPVPARGPVVLIGLDGFEWRVALPLLRRGQLPEIGALARAGTAGRLTTQRPTISPALWTTIATGKGIQQHGIGGFLRSRKPRILYSSRDRKTKAVWNILTDARTRSAGGSPIPSSR